MITTSKNICQTFSYNFYEYILIVLNSIVILTPWSSNSFTLLRWTGAFCFKNIYIIGQAGKMIIILVKRNYDQTYAKVHIHSLLMHLVI